MDIERDELSELVESAVLSLRSISRNSTEVFSDVLTIIFASHLATLDDITGNDEAANYAVERVNSIRKSMKESEVAS